MVQKTVWRHGLYRQFVPLFFLFQIVFSCLAQDPENTGWSYLEELIDQADAANLHQAVYWQILLHYQTTRVGTTKSKIDDPLFFIAPDGKSNPRAELHATLAAFFQLAKKEPRHHPICRFIARFHWLVHELDIDTQRLPEQECETFQQIYDQLQPTSATLVFPSAYMNNPASMFGHTLLIFDSRDKNRLLSKAVNYAAVTQEKFGPFFAFAGMTGLYKGYYSIENYYDKVEQYNDVSHRDMWEYELDFNQKELDRMLRHTWELQNIFSDYYFFQENCSYNLLYLLDAARPSLRLTDEFSLWVIPIDTVKAVYDRGLVRTTVFRPSKSSVIKDLVSKLDDPDQEKAQNIAEGLSSPSEVLINPSEKDKQILILDLAAEYTQYLYTREELDSDVYTPRFLRTLKVRSKLGRPNTLNQRVPVPTHPEDGHAAARIGVGGGIRNTDGFATLQLRPAYHELIDCDIGFDPGSQIQFFNGEIRYYFSYEDLELNHFDFVDVISMSPRDRFFKSTSWGFRAGLGQFKTTGNDALTGVIETRSGYTYAFDRIGLLAMTARVDGRVGGVLDKDYLLGAGPSIDWVTMSFRHYKSVAGVDATWFGVGNDLWRFRASWRQQVFRGVLRGLQLDLRHETIGTEHANEIVLRKQTYF